MQTQILCMYNKTFRVKALKYLFPLCLFATLRKPSQVLHVVCLYSLVLHVYTIDLLLSPAPPPKRAESSKKHKHTYKNVYLAFVLYYAKFVEEKGLESPAVPKPNLYRNLEGFHSGTPLNGILKHFGQRSKTKTYISHPVLFGFTARILKLFQRFCYISVVIFRLNKRR